ncbi:flagellar hook protein FlgE [Halorhodospira halochloris]|uniref:Flagellar hook protein FlgE n=1 Tax=Halorhodospira halochloris TaxID=1052 RepID=A0A110B2K8_HALHR|nr:flagellar hook protein FlgE [Halorhodospira halochloris]MBK1651795.1 flagellar basal body FlaE [Halorhodospira halochloris]BAU58870.1 flagellar hook protein FlgE [Halorhodospira halochloris]
MSFNVALTGINSASKDLETTSNNLSNAGTTGFKKSRAEFNDLFALGPMGIPQLAIGQGSRMANVGQMFNQGSFDFTERSLDLGIEGGGFFRLDDDGDVSYTRAGEFEVDRDGYVVNNTGKRLTGFQTDEDGSRIGDGRDHLRVPTEGIPAQATEEARLGANLNADAEILNPEAFDPEDIDSFNESTTTTFYDSQGGAHDATFYFVKSGENTWEVFTQVEGADYEGDQDFFGPHQLEFDSAGNLIEGDTKAIESEFVANVDDLDVEIDFGDVTQFARPFNVTEVSQDGYTAGEFQNVNVENDGTIYARYNNGETQAVGQVALTQFASEERLQNVGETSWQATAEAGDPLIGVPGQGQFGRIEAGALEQSNVEVSEQLVNMITAQRNFSANAKMISTQDQVTQEILNIR